MRAFNPLLEIDLAALCRNYRRLAAATPSAEAAGVVKSDAYGLGAAAVARALHRREGCRTFFVAYSEEGAAVREAVGDDADIFVFNGPHEPYLDVYRRYRLTPIISTIDQARLWTTTMAGAPVAVHFDTGMRRLGMPPYEIESLANTAGLKISLVMSHLACASDPNHPMNARQRDEFIAIAARFPDARKSLSSSGGALINETFGFDMTRLGVGIYGVNPFDAGATAVEPVARLTAPVLQVRTINAGDAVGYGASFTAQRKSILATISLGYGDGYPRAGSNRAAAWLAETRCPIAGRVSMDLIVLDVTDAPQQPQIGDRAEFFGPNHAIEEAATACGTIGYELLTGIGGLARPRIGLGARVERRYLWNGAPADATIAGE
ncbi:MAG: alanine racemase [Parvularculaceae bacterium]